MFFDSSFVYFGKRIQKFRLTSIKKNYSDNFSFVSKNYLIQETIYRVGIKVSKSFFKFFKQVKFKKNKAGMVESFSLLCCNIFRPNAENFATKSTGLLFSEQKFK